MGITAKGAFEAVKRHFYEMGHDMNTTPITMVGVGDMSGDVFGNGVLLSRQLKVLAAFDHRHIFLDPTPDVAVSFAERQRMFALPRSSWEDYDKKPDLGRRRRVPAQRPSRSSCRRRCAPRWTSRKPRSSA
jgi:glutamate dehydrogenase